VANSTDTIPDKLNPKIKVANTIYATKAMLLRPLTRYAPSRTEEIRIRGYRLDKDGDSTPKVPRNINALPALFILFT
jgi:hypothetical protein